LRTILSKKKFADRCGISVRHLERLNSLGEGPPLIQLGPRRVGIAEDDGEAWLASRRIVPPGWRGQRLEANPARTWPRGAIG
jgi:predicted DNA-binding transcriptional regulator AlpA